MLKELFRLRPKSHDAASLRDAEREAEGALAAVRARVAQIEAGRAAMLLDAEPREVERAEAELTGARAEAERLAAMLTELRERAAAAESRERVEAVRAMHVAAQDAADRFLAFARTEYPRHARAIADGLRLEAEAHRLIDEAMHARLRLPPIEQAEMPPVHPPRLQNPDNHHWGPVTVHGLGAHVRLPAADDNEAAHHWPPHRAR